jgi:hypothetical protein
MPGEEGDADFPGLWQGLLAEEDGDDEGTFRKSGNQKGLHEHFARCTRIAADGFAGFEADETEGDSGTESGTGDGDVSSHFSRMCWLVFGIDLEPPTVFAMVRDPKWVSGCARPLPRECT